MTHCHTVAAMSLMAVGLLASLPACAQAEGDQIIGTPPSIGCCWGDAPSLGTPSADVPALAVALPASARWIRREGGD
ncbi:MAG TPA: hypothetical protein VK558_05310 [Patescibacteria group bacterium]|nr:hypothetical protein [Patescibacteria group bacterium]